MSVSAESTRRTEHAVWKTAIAATAVALLLVVVEVTGLGFSTSLVSGQSSGGLRTDGSPQLCEPCPPGYTGCSNIKCTKSLPPCTGSVSISNVVVTANSTNVSMSWSTSPSRAGDYLDWGNSTAYAFYDASANRSAFLNYLEPGTVYYFEIVGEASFSGSSCSTSIYSATYTGTFTTSSDSMNSFSGIVRDNTNALAPEYTLVLAYCLFEPPNYGDKYSKFYYSTTAPNGNYLMPAPTYFNVAHQAWTPCSDGGGGYVIQAYAVPESVNGTPVGNSAWPNHWNETILTWAPQNINFYLDQSELSSASTPVVTEMEFTHTGNAEVTACSSTTSSEEFQSQSTASGTLFGISYSVQSIVSTTSTFGSGGCISDQGPPGSETWGEVETAGMIVFNAIENRTVSVPWEQYYGSLHNGGDAGSGNASGAPIQDWLTQPTTSSAACTIHGINWLNWPIPADSGPVSETMTVSGTLSSVSGQTWGAAVSLDLDGTVVGSFGYSNSFSITSSQSSEFYVEAVIPNSAITQYFTIACSGGAPSSGTGITMHVWQDAS